jgi:hypothetical protein
MAADDIDLLDVILGQQMSIVTVAGLLSIPHIIVYVDDDHRILNAAMASGGVGSSDVGYVDDPRAQVRVGIGTLPSAGERAAFDGRRSAARTVIRDVGFGVFLRIRVQNVSFPSWHGESPRIPDCPLCVADWEYETVEAQVAPKATPK